MGLMSKGIKMKEEEKLKRQLRTTLVFCIGFIFGGLAMFLIGVLLFLPL